MTQIEILPDVPDQDIDVNSELDALAKRYGGASGLGMKVLGVLGMPVSGLLKSLPGDVQDGLGGATEVALMQAVKWADGSRGLVKDQPDWINASVTAALGAAGGRWGRDVVVGGTADHGDGAVARDTGRGGAIWV